MTCKFKNLAALTSAESGEALEESSFEGGKPEVKMALTPIVLDEGTVESLDETTDLMSKLTTFVTGGSFFISMFLGGSMQYLYGLFRALQMITLSALVFVTFPVESIYFFQGLLLFANMDIFSGEEFFDGNFEFKETDPYNDHYDTFGMGNKKLDFASYFSTPSIKLNLFKRF